MKDGAKIESEQAFAKECDRLAKEYDLLAWKKLKAAGLHFWNIENAGKALSIIDDMFQYAGQNNQKMLEESMMQWDENLKRDENEQSVYEWSQGACL